jgi:hypothetical protein
MRELLLLIRELPGLILGIDTAIEFLWIPLDPAGKCRNSTLKQTTASFHIFSVHHSTSLFQWIIRKFVVTKASLNKERRGKSL